MNIGGISMIGWRDGDDGLHRDSLFGVFAALARGEAWSFPALRAHQREPWHAFTVQVAALALIRAERDDLPGDEAMWRELLIALTPDQPDGEAWSLVVDDWTRPALLQPPVVADANRADYKSRLPTPDALDMLVTSRNHDVKQERMATAGEEEWLFALVTLQTTEGFLGAGNYGISRMNGGFATRMSLGVRPSGGGAAGEFRRDVQRLVADARARPDRRAGIGLMWLEPWDGTRSLGFGDLDELYVEVCRRIRLRRTASGIEALAAGSKVARVAAGALGGNTGDPWAPTTIDTNKARQTTFGKPISVSPGANGFGYRQMTRLLDQDKVTRPLLAHLHEDDEVTGLAMVAAALVRGQGKTEGLHRRRVRLSRIEDGENIEPDKLLDVIGGVAKVRADDAYEAGRRLRRALILMMQGGPDQARLDDDSAGRKVDPWVKRFDAIVDRRFFEDDFWTTAAATGAGEAEVPKDHRQAWRQRLRGLASDVFAEAAEAAPRTEMRRVRAIARGRSMLDGQMTNWLKEMAA
jgi:CRISPR system Cascade subunit CasA